MTGQITAVQALVRVMQDLKAVGKEGRNTFDNYNFRGIDGVMNAVGPVFRKHAVVALPDVVEYQRRDVTSSKGAAMTSVALKMVVRFYGPAGDHIDCTVWGEAFDRGDKATAKAHSVAFRTALLQTLCLPTQESDPDEYSYEQGHATAGRGHTQLVNAAEEATTVEELQDLWKRASEQGVLDDEMAAFFKRRAAEVKQ